MLTSNRGWRLIAAIFLTALIFAIGWPTAFVVTHGFNPDGWPPNIIGPIEWYAALSHLDLLTLVVAYKDVALGLSPAFAGGGFNEAVTLAVLAIISGVVITMGGRIAPLRDASGIYGNAQWASKSELARMTKGLELGVAAQTGCPVRAQVEGNLVTIGPPRSGKTGGFIIPNLAFAEPNAWAGPAVVIDPKGDAYRAVRRRRVAMGRTVRCLDPINLVGGTDRWNPLSRVDANDVLYQQSMAAALLPQTAQQTDAGAYFRSRAIDLIVGALQCSILEGRADPVRAAELLQEEALLLKALEAHAHPAAIAARQILTMEDRSRDGIVSTVRQAMQWLLDERLRAVVQDHTFELSDLSNGDVDLFIVLPADGSKSILAPYVRWLLADLFDSVRRNKPVERIIAFIDEANVLGRFDAILSGVGELPGYGISLWTFWQSRFQMAETYGPDGAEVLLGTAEMTNIFNLPASQPDELERWSKAIGSFTGVKTSRGRDPRSGKETESQSPESQRLVAASDLAAFSKEWQVVFMNSRAYTTNPIKLRRIESHTDRRFVGLIDAVAPVGTTG